MKARYRLIRRGIRGGAFYSVDTTYPAEGARWEQAQKLQTGGYPERFAQEAFGHNSKAVHRAYAKRALVKIPSLEEYEQRATTSGVTISPKDVAAA